jgi:soluble lytic murein transglycosylase-like protein
MRSNLVFRAVLAALCLGAGAVASAQAPAPAAATGARQRAGGARATAPGGASQRIERIEVEDAGSRIDELRVGGQTQSITVHPKADVPPYNVQPANPSHPDGRDGAGRRTWNVLSF